jgi:hypothetical protein
VVGCVVAGEVGEEVLARAEDLLWRTDFRTGVAMETPLVFVVEDGFTFEYVTEAGVLRVSRLMPFFGVPFVWVDFAAWRELRLGGSGVGGAVSLFTREDLRTPFSKTVVGPSTAKGFHGGETARDAEGRGVRSSTLRRFAGRSVTPPSSPFASVASSSSFMPTVLSS